jgi:hypothetical protein
MATLSTQRDRWPFRRSAARQHPMPTRSKLLESPTTARSALGAGSDWPSDGHGGGGAIRGRGALWRPPGRRRCGPDRAAPRGPSGPMRSHAVRRARRSEATVGAPRFPLSEARRCSPCRLRAGAPALPWRPWCSARRAPHTGPAPIGSVRPGARVRVASAAPFALELASGGVPPVWVGCHATRLEGEAGAAAGDTLMLRRVRGCTAVRAARQGGGGAARVVHRPPTAPGLRVARVSTGRTILLVAGLAHSGGRLGVVGHEGRPIHSTICGGYYFPPCP